MIVGSLLLILVAVGLLVAGVLGGSNALIVCSIAVVVLAAIVLVIGVRQSAAVGGSLDDVDDDADADADADELTNEYAMSDSGFRVRQAERRSRSERSDARMDAGEEPAGGRRGSRTMLDDEPVAMSETTAEHGPLAVDAPSRGIPSQGYPDETEQHAPVYETPTYETSAYQSPAYETQLIEAVTDDIDDDEDPPDEPSAQLVTPASAARVAMLSTEVLVVDGRPRYHVPGCVHLLSRETEPIPVGEAVELGFTPCGLCEPDSALLADARRV